MSAQAGRSVPPAPAPAAARAGLGGVLGLALVLAGGACLLVACALVSAIHPARSGVVGLEDQAQSAKTAAYLIAVVLVLPAALVLVPRLADALAAGPNGRLLAGLAGALGITLLGVIVLVRLLPHAGVRAMLVAVGVWWAGAGLLLAAALRRALPGGLARAGSRGAAWVGGALALAVVLALTSLSGLSAVALVAGAAVALVLLVAGRRLGARRLPRGAGAAIDAVVVVGLLLAVPNVVVYEPAGIPNAFFAPGIIQFHQDWLLGPANQLLGGGALLVNVPVSQYGVGFIYFLAGWFHIAPIGYGTYGLLDGIVTALFYICAYGLLRVVGAPRPLAVGTLALAVVAFVYHLAFSVGQLPQQGPLRFGLPMAVVVAEAVAVRRPNTARAMRALSLLTVAAAAVWSLEMLAYTAITYAAIVAYRAWLAAPGGRRRVLFNGLAAMLAAGLAAHVLLALLTLVATGHLPDWGQYAVYVDALVLGHAKAGQISYGFAAWSPGLAVGFASLASALGVVLVLRRAPGVARADPVRFLALAGLSTYALVLYSYTDNRSSTYLLPYVSLPLLLAGVLWLAVVLRHGPARLGRVALAGSLALACLMVAAAAPTVGRLYSQSALAHVGGLRAALHRLWHAPPIDPRAPGGVRLLERDVPGTRVLVLLPDLPDLGTEILIRSHRVNALFIGDPKADGFIDPSEWTGIVGRQLAAVRPGTRLLTDPDGLAVADALRGRPAAVALDHPLGAGNPQLEWILQRLADRFDLEPVARDRDGLVVAQLAPR